MARVDLLDSVFGGQLANLDFQPSFSAYLELLGSLVVALVVVVLFVIVFLLAWVRRSLDMALVVWLFCLVVQLFYWRLGFSRPMS